LPRLASETVVWAFLEAGASALILRSNQCGGLHPQIEPVAPITLPL
jgi:predicted Abi (CAAX) family protease